MPSWHRSTNSYFAVYKAKRKPETKETVVDIDAVLTPAYEPEKQLVELVRRLKEAGFEVVVVDDGSGPAYKEIFDAVRQDACVVVHEKNRGKGAALKTGMAYIQENMPHAEHFITCDADGQHRVEDVIRVSQQLQAGHKFVLTMRKLKKDIPLRSKVGNDMSRVVYTLLTKRYLSDNQSGLRGFDRSHIKWMLKVERDKYDYEMNVLYYAAKKSIRIHTILIDAIYIDNNQSSHFQPVKDTVRIYRSLFKLAMGLFAGFFAAQLWMALAGWLLGGEHILLIVPAAGIVGYLASVITDSILFRDTRCYDQLTQLIHQIIAYVLYTLGVMLLLLACPGILLWGAYNLVFFLCLPLRYWLYKFTFIALRTRE